MPFKKFIYFRHPHFTMENSLSYIIFYWFFATHVHQHIIYIFPVKKKIGLKFCESFRFFLVVFMEKLNEMCYLNYVRRRIVLY